ncbi:hypothetical protein ASPZODRAFT_152483 [Penicilliopsis zonata CBS 506.65]|uniref:FAD-binding domain-containing protein n=1 Tax=Penicilliopsis zonata CBS 506.65 TaxID=1073090 RepID=A0A1L9SGK5_9EURO|nr:hypothetical protein ASPZODRAFT_152483 [Penicilliopsis zonata CBS 506.65]OJJ46302.1 hypothetical protein ASPZODRAFT_152483 [Penicilliopsis zonata CBS 506.65]
MKIIIIGAGISGCAVYLLLKKHLPAEDHHSYIIYEAYDTSQKSFQERTAEDTHSATLVVGGGIGLAPNGLNVLRRLDEDLFHDVVRSGYPYSRFKLKSSFGWTLQEIDARGGDADHPIESVSMSRHALWSCLKNRVPTDAFICKKVKWVTVNPNGRHVVHFADDSPPEEADLVIGADGLKSVVKKALFCSDPSSEDPYPPHYEGLVGVGGFFPVAEDMRRTITPKCMTIAFGGQGFFGYSYSSPTGANYYLSSPPPSPDALLWWSTYFTPTCPDHKSIDSDSVTAQLRARHASWPDPVVQRIIGSARVESMYPIWTTPELPVWDREGVILLGDAAHALPPNSGQGSSQALEDAEALALFLAHHLRAPQTDSAEQRGISEREAVKLATKQYTDLRFPRVHAVGQEAKRMKQREAGIGLLTELIISFFIWVMGLFSSGPQKQLYNYNIAEEVESVLSK